MNSAVCVKIIRDTRWQLLVSAALLFAFAWLFVWMNSLIKMGLWSAVLDMLPNFVHKLMPVPAKELLSPTGRISLVFVHIVPMILFVGWALVRGSEMISGEIESGRFEVLLTLPVPRPVWVFIPGTVTFLGAVILAMVLWAGLWAGCHQIRLGEPVDTTRFHLAALNLAMMAFAVAGITSAISACFHSRGKTLAIATVLFVAAVIVKLVARLWTAGEWLKYLSFMTLFEPQLLIFSQESARISLHYNLALGIIGVVGHLIAAAILAWRDIPVPR